MEDHLPRQSTAQRDCLPQCRLHEVGVDGVGDAASEDPAGVTVTDDTQVCPPLTGAQIRDVREPGEIALALVELPLDEIRDGKRVIPVDGRLRPIAWCTDRGGRVAVNVATVTV